jgi:hypothetical protein
MEIIVLCLGFDIFRCTSGSLYRLTNIPEMRNYSVRLANYILEHPEDVYFPDAMEKYFARPRVSRFEVLTYFDYFAYHEVTKTRTMNQEGPREGWQDLLGYWIYQRKKPILIRTLYRRLCDGEVFFYVQLLYKYHWRSDDEIISNFTTYTNSMLSDKGISNGSIGVITNLLSGDEVEAAFPTKDGIQVSSPTSILRGRRTLTALILNRRAADRS